MTLFIHLFTLECINIIPQREHNETLAKLNFVLALVDCILELARSRSAPITALTHNTTMRESVSAGQHIHVTYQKVWIMK